MATRRRDAYRTPWDPVSSFPELPMTPLSAHSTAAVPCFFTALGHPGFSAYFITYVLAMMPTISST